MNELSDLIERLGGAVRAELRRRAASRHLPAAQLEVLRYLARCNRYSDTPAAAAEYVDATPGTVSQTVSALERKGLVEKRPDPRDGRRVHCVVTELGLRLLAELEPPELREVPEAEAAAAARALTALLARMQQARGGRTFGVCHTCAHHRVSPHGAHCGLTGEPLLPPEVTQICREHTPP